jgi:adenosine deaminase
MALDGASCLQAIDEAFRARPGGCDCRILLDVVRQWGPESAERVLDLHERNPLPSVLGFGMGGDEKAMPAAAFAGVYMRARALGLKTSVHAGEWAGPDSLEEALDVLRPDRVDHGIAAAADARLAERLADERTTLCVAPTGNVATGAAKSYDEHPLSRLIEARARGALGRRPASFSTTTANEFQVARDRFGIEDSMLHRLAERLARRLLLAAGTRSRHRRSRRLGSAPCHPERSEGSLSIRW